MSASAAAPARIARRAGPQATGRVMVTGPDRPAGRLLRLTHHPAEGGGDELLHRVRRVTQQDLELVDAALGVGLVARRVVSGGTLCVTPGQQPPRVVGPHRGR